MISISIMFILGGFFAMMMPLELLTPEGDLLTSDTYNKFFTLHGIIMIFFFSPRRFRRCLEISSSRVHAAEDDD
jgi:heme/copper-type cytochrome/quinol oxidase subunit 1